MSRMQGLLKLYKAAWPFPSICLLCFATVASAVFAAVECLWCLLVCHMYGDVLT
jgi:hypothetical protein